MENSSHRCINCSIRLQHLSWQSLREVDIQMYNTLASWISPTPISHEDLICTACFNSIQQVLSAGTTPTPLFGHTNVCFACGKSILRVRTSRVHPNSEERKIILHWIFPHLGQHLHRVCRACWMAAKRNVQRQLQQDEKKLGSA